MGMGQVIDESFENVGYIVCIFLIMYNNDFYFTLYHYTVSTLGTWVQFFFQKTWLWTFLLPTALAHLDLTIIIGLCMDGGESLVSKFLRTKVMQFFGRISFSIYLIQ